MGSTNHSGSQVFNTNFTTLLLVYDAPNGLGPSQVENKTRGSNAQFLLHMSQTNSQSAAVRLEISASLIPARLTNSYVALKINFLDFKSCVNLFF